MEKSLRKTWPENAEEVVGKESGGFTGNTFFIFRNEEEKLSFLSRLLKFLFFLHWITAGS